MSLIWLWAAAGCMLVVASGQHGGGASLRGALEALQRRQRGRMHGPIAPPPDNDPLYEFLPPIEPYSNPDYLFDFDDKEEEPPTKYIVKYLEANVHPPEAYPVIKKKNNRPKSYVSAIKDSSFRERNHHADNDKLKELFIDRKDTEDNNYILQEQGEDDDEYAQLLNQLWSKFKYGNRMNRKKPDSAPQGIVKLYKEKRISKRYSDNWGPIAFKRKRSSGSEEDHTTLTAFEGGRKPHGDGMPVDPNYNTYDLSDDEKDDIREEYAIAFQPLEDDSISNLRDDQQYAYDTIEKRFPVTKRSSGSSIFSINKQTKRSLQDYNKFRGSSGTDPKIIKDLSKIFGDGSDNSMKNPVKRNSDNADNTKETYEPPQVAGISHNEENLPKEHHDTHGDHHLDNKENVESHEQHGYLHHPGMFGKESEHPEIVSEKEKPKTVKKKSIDWSDYFGIDKRKKKSSYSLHNLRPSPMKKLYFNTFNNEVIYPLNNFEQHSKVKRNYVETKQREDDSPMENDHTTETKMNEKRDLTKDNVSKLENLDKKFKNMEGFIVDEALHYSNVGDDLDSKEEQEMKEKLLSKLAAAFSLEKMRKALKDFKQSLQITKNDPSVKSPEVSDGNPNKRVAVKKELENEIRQPNKEEGKNGDFEDEQGAGHFLNGKMETQFSEGYMGGSGRHKVPAIPTVSAGSCPVYSKIVQRCHEVDLWAGDRGQLFLPLCSLHQICYLCGDPPPTICDLVFLSEADESCEGDMGCQRAARSALMTLRELHDSLADELDGECEASPCLTGTLNMNLNWQRAINH